MLSRTKPLHIPKISNSSIILSRTKPKSHIIAIMFHLKDILRFNSKLTEIGQISHFNAKVGTYKVWQRKRLKTA